MINAPHFVSIEKYGGQGPGLQPRAQGARDKRPGDEVAWTCVLLSVPGLTVPCWQQTGSFGNWNVVKPQARYNTYLARRLCERQKYKFEIKI